ncbi:MAG: T9SS type A sorting domain-containing protein [Balneolaceae bacterium]
MTTYTNMLILNSNKLLGHISKLLLTVTMILFAGNTAIAQRTVEVEPGLGTLNEAIDSDTTETGERVDPNTVYVLERDGYYALEGTIQNRGYHLTIVAEDGDGERPQLVPAAGDGGVSSRPFRPRGDLTLRGLYVTGEDNTGTLNEDQRIIRVSENNARIIIDDCHLEKDGQTVFRIDNAGNRIFVLNSTLSNIGTTASPDNGRAVDDRGSQIDTLVMENSTFYNLTSIVLQDFGGEINYARVNQNTIVNIGRRGTFEFGQVLELEFTNNIVIDGAFYGQAESEFAEDPNFIVRVDSLSPTQVDSLGEASITISHNNIYHSSEFLDAYPDTVEAAPFFNAAAEAYIAEAGTGDTNISTDITFENGPEKPVDVMTSYYETPDATQPDMPTDGEPFDFSYDTSHEAYTAGTNGQPLGAISWFGMTVSNEVEERPSNTPAAFKLNGNYPNPFNPTTNVSFDLPQAAQVSVDVYSVIGQKVMSIPAQQMSSGNNRNIMLDASSLTSGMYIYRITAKTATNTMVNTGRMTLIK